MAVHHTSRTGKQYYLHVKTTSTGRSTCFFSTDADGTLADQIPAGYEVYENIHGQVFLRRKVPQAIKPEDLQLVQAALLKLDDPWRYQAEVKKDGITIYMASGMDDETLRLSGLRRLSDTDKRRFASYQAMMRFTLMDPKTRAFVAERYCFRGCIDNWIPIGGPNALAAHVRKFVKHLGQESFFELH